MKKALLLLSGLLLALPLSAGVVNLSDFSSFAPSYYGFSGSWSADTAQSGPDSFTIADFSAGTPKNDGSFTKFLGSTQNFSSYSYVLLNGTASSGNATSNLAFFLEDADGASGMATFQLANFTGDFAALSLSGLYSALDPTRIVSWGFTTENQFGDKNFAFTFDHVALSTTPIPEPSTYAALLGAATLGIVAIRRRRRTEP